MRAMTAIPGKPGSGELTEVPEPVPSDGSVLVDALLLGICGTDLEVIEHGLGNQPPGEERLILGHESLGRVREAPAGTGLEPGDLVAGIVRHPDPVPCPACARGEADFCRNGLYTERGIRKRHGFGAEQWRVDPGFAVKVPAELGDLGVLVEPGSDVAKVWDQVEMIGSRSWYEPSTVLVTGAGPIGLLAALLGVQRGLDVYVLDQMEKGAKPTLVRDLGARYVTSLDQVGAQVDIAIECTGVGALAYGAARLLAPAGVLCLIGISHRETELPVAYEALNRELVMKNAAIVGSVNAARRHFVDAVDALLDADREWLGRLITRRVPLSRWQDALDRLPDDVKVVVDLQG